MADNVELSAGSGGDTIAADDVGGVKYQVVKLAVGADGAASLVANANPIPVSDAGGNISIDDGGNNISIDDGGNTITVDGTVAVTNAGLTALNGAISGTEVQVDVLTMPTVTVNAHHVTNAGTFAVQVDGSALTALQLIDDTVYVDDADWTDNTSKHVLVGGVYQSTQHTVTDGDVSPIAVDENGNVRVNIVAGAAAGGTSVADDADFTDGTTALTPVGGVYESTPSTVTDGDIGMVGITENRELKVNVSSGGVQGIVDDAPFTAGSSEGVLMMGVASADTVNADDAGAIAMTTARAMHVAVQSIAAGNTNIGDVDIASIAAGNNNIGDVDIASIAAGDNNIGNVDIVSLPASTNTLEVVGDVAHDAGVAGNPVQIGGYATNNIEGVTQVAAGDLTRIVHDLNGVQVTRPHTTLEEIQTVRTTNTDGASTSLISAAGSGVHNYVTHVTIWNSSATDGFVDFRDGTAGAVIHTFPAPQTGGCTVAFNPPLKFGDNTAVAYDASGAISTIYISAVYFQAQG